MRYISNTPAQQREMLARIGTGSIEDLLAGIPAKARLSRPLTLPAAMAETDLVRHLRAMAARNAGADDYACFLGAGSYDHAIPSPINHLISRGEWYTAYTPYQPEASQGTLRTIFEYQTMMAELTGMDVANASIYDGASSLAEAVLMAHAVTGRDAILLSRGVNPLYRQVVETYCEGVDVRLRSAPLGDGVTDLEALRKAVSEKTADRLSPLAFQLTQAWGALPAFGAPDRDWMLRRIVLGFARGAGAGGNFQVGELAQLAYQYERKVVTARDLVRRRIATLAPGVNAIDVCGAPDYDQPTLTGLLDRGAKVTV
ncbi:MAG: hypothetical protein AAB328_14185, partial [candidate division NC10 bacterium]